MEAPIVNQAVVVLDNQPKIPVRVQAFNTSRLPIELIGSVLEKEFCADATAEYVLEIIMKAYKRIQPIDLTILCNQENGTSTKSKFCQSEFEEAFRKYNADKTIKLVIDVDCKVWPAFPSPFGSNTGYGDGHRPKTLRELEMIKLSATIRRKNSWYEKMNNPEITSRWTSEAIAQGLSEKQISYVLQELQYYASLRDQTIGLEVSDIDGVWHSDVLIDEDLKKTLVAGVTLLENVPESKKDWHPGSNQQVLDLVHPSIYPFVYGVTPTLELGEVVKPSLKFCGGGKMFAVVETENVDEVDYSTSNKFAWLPSEFIIHEDGKVTIDSYINNLHPKHHKELYRTLQKIFAKFVPLFENVINDQFNIRANRIELTNNWYGDDDFQEPSDDEDYSEAYEEWKQNRVLNHPEAPEHFVPPPNPENRFSLLGTQVQVIVKLANIVLTPEKPKYRGGVWHVEGMKNERIVATGIYYYDVENITDSELGFRQDICEPDYEQNDDRGVSEIYGLSDEDPLNQVLGSVLTKENRCLVFPNMYQHRVHPFQLKDPTKPGHRKILVFFLVDPGERIISTKSVPPQQFEWYVEQLYKISPFDGYFPCEIVEHIVSFCDWPVTMEKAKEWRQELMDERKYFISANSENLFERPFSLCEH